MGMEVKRRKEKVTPLSCFAHVIVKKRKKRRANGGKVKAKNLRHIVVVSNRGKSGSGRNSSRSSDNSRKNSSSSRG